MLPAKLKLAKILYYVYIYIRIYIYYIIYIIYYIYIKICQRGPSSLVTPVSQVHNMNNVAVSRIHVLFWTEIHTRSVHTLFTLVSLHQVIRRSKRFQGLFILFGQLGLALLGNGLCAKLSGPCQGCKVVSKRMHENNTVQRHTATL